MVTKNKILSKSKLRFIKINRSKSFIFLDPQKGKDEEERDQLLLLRQSNRERTRFSKIIIILYKDLN